MLDRIVERLSSNTKLFLLSRVERRIALHEFRENWRTELHRRESAG